jgi:hypothetical protein
VTGSTAADATASSREAEERAVIATLETLVRAYMDKDLATVDRIYHDALSHGHSSGVIDDKATVLADVKRRYWKIGFTGKAHVEGTMAYVRSVMDFRVGTTPEMTTHKPDMRILWVLIKTERGWQVIAYQALRVAPPPA